LLRNQLETYDLKNENLHSDEQRSEFRDGWPVVLAATFGVGVGLIGAPIFTLGTFIVPLSKTFGWTRTQVSLSSFCMVFGTIISAMFVGRIVDRFGARRIGIISLILLCAALVGMTQITADIRTFYFGLILLSLAGCGTSPIIWTRGVALWFDKNRGLAFGLTLAGTGIAGMVMPPFIGWVIAHHDWRAGYLGLAAATAVALIPVVLFFREPSDRELADRRSPLAQAQHAAGMALGEALRTRRFWQLGLVNFFVTSATSLLIIHLVPLLIGAGIGRSTAANLSAIMGATIIFGRFSTGYLMDRFHPPFVGCGYLLIAGLGVILIELALPNLVGVGIAIATFGLAAGAEVQLVAFMTSRYFGLKSYGQIYAVQFILFELGVGFGPAAAGRIFDAYGNYTNALYLCLAAFVVGGVTLAALGKPPKWQPN